MKEKIIVGIIALMFFIGMMFTVIIIKQEKIEDEPKVELIISESSVTDDCTEEYENITEVSSSEEKISSNSALILKKYYKECGHTINEYVEMLPELVNLTEEEVCDKFKDWDLIGFSTREVTLFKEFVGTCGEHFSLREENGMVVIYRRLVDGTREVYEKTEISTQFLPETDLVQMQSEEGIMVHGKEELNKVLEDFE